MSPTVQVEDDILQPSDSMKIDFKGKHPFAACEKFPEYLRDIMKVSRKDIVETDLRWDITSDPRTFYGWWAGSRKEDRWTRTTIRIIAQGEQGTNFKGSIKIIIKGTITTTYEYSNFIQKSFWWFFNHMFYYNNRRRYFEFAKDNIMEIREALLKQFEIYREA
ncbi:MAG: hypothetical protein HY364_03805 [Candidatus Aenigmarchaeota archaeon]|nr:hypothetical protein [Candidatus Aenigmarchaeota archaeon]